MMRNGRIIHDGNSGRVAAVTVNDAISQGSPTFSLNVSFKLSTAMIQYGPGGARAVNIQKIEC